MLYCIQILKEHYMEIRYPDDFIRYYDTDDEIVEVGEFELLYPDNYELRDINDESDTSSFGPFCGYYDYCPSPNYLTPYDERTINIDDDSLRPGHGGGHFPGGGGHWPGGGGHFPGGGGHFPGGGGHFPGGGGHFPGWGSWYGPWLWPILWPKYCPGPDCPCPGDDCPCPGPDCPCSGPDCPRTDFIYSADDADGYRTIPKSIYDITNKVKNISGTVYDTFKPPLPIDSNQRQSGPVSPPPSYIPSKNDKNVKYVTTQTTTTSGVATPKSVSPGSINFCLFKFTYIWQTNGRAYWAYLLRVDRQSISGFRWAGWRWVYFGVDLRRIEAFVC